MTSRKTIEALNKARGEQSWDDFIAKAPRTRDGFIIISKNREKAGSRGEA